MTADQLKDLAKALTVLAVNSGSPANAFDPIYYYKNYGIRITYYTDLKSSYVSLDGTQIFTFNKEKISIMDDNKRDIVKEVINS